MPSGAGARPPGDSPRRRPCGRSPRGRARPSPARPSRARRRMACRGRRRSRRPGRSPQPRGPRPEPGSTPKLGYDHGFSKPSLLLRQPGCLRETPGFATPPRGGSALVGSACEWGSTPLSGSTSSSITSGAHCIQAAPPGPVFDRRRGRYRERGVPSGYGAAPLARRRRTAAEVLSRKRHAESSRQTPTRGQSSGAVGRSDDTAPAAA